MRHRGLAVNDPRTGEEASYLIPAQCRRRCLSVRRGGRPGIRLLSPGPWPRRPPSFGLSPG
jgi:hypothetical protein